MEYALWKSAPSLQEGDPSRVDSDAGCHPGVLRTPRLLSDDASSVLVVRLRIVIYYFVVGIIIDLKLPAKVVIDKDRHKNEKEWPERRKYEKQCLSLPTKTCLTVQKRTLKPADIRPEAC